MKIKFARLDRKKMNWRPRVGCWNHLWVGFFDQIAQAPKDSLYEVIGRHVRRVARQFEPADRGTYYVGSLLWNRGDRGVFNVEIQIEQNGRGGSGHRSQDYIAIRVRATYVEQAARRILPRRAVA